MKAFRKPMVYLSEHMPTQPHPVVFVHGKSRESGQQRWSMQYLWTSLLGSSPNDPAQDRESIPWVKQRVNFSWDLAATSLPTEDLLCVSSYCTRYSNLQHWCFMGINVTFGNNEVYFTCLRSCVGTIQAMKWSETATDSKKHKTQNSVEATKGQNTAPSLDDVWARQPLALHNLKWQLKIRGAMTMNTDLPWQACN